MTLVSNIGCGYCGGSISDCGTVPIIAVVIVLLAVDTTTVVSKFYCGHCDHSQHFFLVYILLCR